ncbi:hypothetical protein LSG31_10465 [Fodinisporobacter ferrooxydans]|uniref:Isoprenylcysteine carboxyl methyltransferase n=1 Tax=Fodinisporobacter ferrooxydans TaxID=2901836 RepID=A0ABY4CQI5_9BACL|nr:hypothetical protein LSG31_10465 [Alicyclobacillaceae bacterium MYW30-H2]
MSSDYFFTIVFSLLIFQRLLELWIAKRNSNWIISQGGYEIGKDHFKYIVLIHTGFLCSLCIEVMTGTASPPDWYTLPFFAFVTVQILRYWCIVSLGHYWNTRIFIVPGRELIKNGPYRWLSHPNYLIVSIEFFLLPLIFGAYYTLAVWPIINYMFLKFVRIPVEKSALEIAEKITLDT